MFSMIKQWIAPEKAQLNGVIQGKLPADVVRQLEQFVRRYNLAGNLRVIRESYAEFLLEGPKPRLDQFLADLPQCAAMSGKTMKIAWGDYQGKLNQFRISWQ